MSTEFRFPDVGEGIHEGTIVKWLFNEGDTVKADQTIVEVETDKAIVELPSPATGTILKINYKVSDLVKVGEVLVIIGDKNEKIQPTQISNEKNNQKTQPSSHPISDMIKSTSTAPYTRPLTSSNIDKQNTENQQKPNLDLGIQNTKEILAAPSTRKLARDLGIDISQINGSGPGGRILPSDVQKFTANTSSTVSTSLDFGKKPTDIRVVSYQQSAPMTSDKILQLSNLRKVIAERMTYSKTHIPHACAMDLVDVTRLVEIREREKINAQNKGIKLTYLPFVIKAVVLSMYKYQILNSHFDEQKNEIIMRAEKNIGIAVDTEEGLMAPVIKNADKKTILSIASEIEQFASAARNRKIKLEDLKGSTFTITNVGSSGGMFSTPIINPPEVAILGVHRIKDMPLVANGKIEIRKALGLSICFDHRVLDGAVATLFLNEIKNYLEDPDLMLVDLV